MNHVDGIYEHFKFNVVPFKHLELHLSSLMVDVDVIHKNDQLAIVNFFLNLVFLLNLVTVLQDLVHLSILRVHDIVSFQLNIFHMWCYPLLASAVLDQLRLAN